MTATESQPKAESSFHNADSVIRNFDRFDHEWKADQKETLNAFDGIKNNIPVQAVSDHIVKSPGWIRSTASVPLLFYQNHENRHDPFEIFFKF
jgi:hypothetical protein